MDKMAYTYSFEDGSEIQIKIDEATKSVVITPADALTRIHTSYNQRDSIVQKVVVSTKEIPFGGNL